MSTNSNCDVSFPEYIPTGDLNFENSLDGMTRADFGEWYTVSDTTQRQYRSTVKIEARLSNGGIAHGSGFLIGPAAVVTAAHCVYNSAFGDDCLAESITIIPAANGNTANYGTANAVSFVVYNEWTDNFNSQYDWAIIRLNNNIGNNTGYLGLASRSSYNQTSITVNGYPGIINGTGNRRMYYTTGNITGTTQYYLKSNNTCTEGGMSGGPVYTYSSSNGYTALGLLIGASPANNPTYNVFIKFTADICNELASYRNYSV